MGFFRIGRPVCSCGAIKASLTFSTGQVLSPALWAAQLTITAFDLNQECIPPPIRWSVDRDRGFRAGRVATTPRRIRSENFLSASISLDRLGSQPASFVQS